jgi:hypothetical protein
MPTARHGLRAASLTYPDLSKNLIQHSGGLLKRSIQRFSLLLFEPISALIALKAALPCLEACARLAKSAPAKKNLMTQIQQIKSALEAAEQASPHRSNHLRSDPDTARGLVQS